MRLWDRLTYRLLVFCFHHFGAAVHRRRLKMIEQMAQEEAMRQ